MICFGFVLTPVFRLGRNFFPSFLVLMPNVDNSSALCVLKCWMLMPSSVKDVRKEREKRKETQSLFFTVDKLQFKAPVQKETAAHYETVIIMFCLNHFLFNTNFSFCL